MQVDRQWDAQSGCLTLRFRQHTPPTPGQPQKKPLVIPVLWALVDADGTTGEERLLVLDQAEQTLVVEGLQPAAQPPALSLFRQFSAPVRFSAPQTPEELFHLFAFDNDAFARWDAGQQLWRQLLLARAAGQANAVLEDQMHAALQQLLAEDGEQDPAILATLLSFPGSAELEALQQEADPLGLYQAACGLRAHFGRRLAGSLQLRLQ